MEKHLFRILLTVSIFVTGGFFANNAYAAVTSVTINSPTAGQSAGSSFSLQYTVTDDGANTATAGTITFTRTGGTADANSPHTYNMAAGDFTTGAHSLSRSTLQTGFGNSLVDGTVYDIQVSVTDGGAFTDTENGVTMDFTAPTFTAAKGSANNQIIITWSENVDSAADSNTPWTVTGGLTVTAATALDGTGSTQTLTLSGSIPDGSSLSVTYTAGGNGDIEDTADVSPNAAQTATVTVGGIPGVAGTSGCSDCVPPTLGLDENGARQVENGFRCVQGSKEFVANATDWYTPMDLLVFDVGVPAHCTVKVFENWGTDNITYVGFAWGVNSRNIFGLAPIQVDYFRGDKPTNILDPQNLIDVSGVSEGKASCMDGGEQKCLTVTVNFTPRQKLDNTAILVQLWDLRPNVSYTRFNHGMQFDGISLNPDIVSKTMDGRNLVTLTSKADMPNKAVDEDGNAWTYSKGWKKIFIEPDYACSLTAHGFDRYCPEFGQMMVGQQYLARQYFDSSAVESRAGPFVAGPDYPDHPRTYQTLMFKNMVDLAINDNAESEKN